MYGNPIWPNVTSPDQHDLQMSKSRAEYLLLGFTGNREMIKFWAFTVLIHIFSL